MGNDGGTIAVQRSLVIQLKKPKSQRDWKAFYHLFWSTCAFSQKPLRPSQVVACRKGFLYDKASLIEALLQKRFKGSNNKNDTTAAALKKQFGHIRKLSHVTDVNFERNPDFSPEKAEEQTQWMCPLASKPIEGSQKCYLMRKCGHVVNEMSWNNRDLNKTPENRLAQELGISNDENEANENANSLKVSSQDEVEGPQPADAASDSNGKHHEPRLRECLVCGKQYNEETDLTILSPSLENYQRVKMLKMARNSSLPAAGKDSGKKRKRDESSGSSPPKKRKLSSTASS